MSDFEGPSNTKYARYDDGESIPGEEEEDCGTEGFGTEYKSKHTLDSDEEEDIKYKKLDISKAS